MDIPCKPTIVDTVALARVLLPNLNRFKLDTVAKALGVSLEITIVQWMMPDVRQRFFVKFIEMLRERGMSTLDEVNAMGTSSVQNVQKMPTYHAIILATCDQGRTNLYKLISLAHIKYYHRRPRIPKSEFIRYRMDF